MPRFGSLRLRSITRRGFLGDAAKGLAALIVFDGVLRPLIQPAVSVSPAADRRQRFGATFSPLKAAYLDLDYRDAFGEILSLDLDFIRLGAYWSEIEKRKGEIVGFESLDWLLDQVAAHGRTKAILTVGMKAPVYPEFHFPPWVLEELDLPRVGVVSRDPWLREYGLRFVRAVVERYADAAVVRGIQVENEPFDPVLYDYQTYRFLGEDFLREEVTLVRSSDRLGRPIVLNLFVETSPLTSVLANFEESALPRLVIGNLAGRRNREVAIDLADVVGFDVYGAVGWELFGRRFYIRPWRDADFNNLVNWRRRVERAGKAAYIMEAQAEPWEPGSAVHIKQRQYPSFDPERMERFIAQLVRLGYRDICLWGVEHWLWHRRAGHPEWWEKGTDMLAAYR